MNLKQRLKVRIIRARFERAYIRLYSGEIAVDRFLETCGIDRKDKAWKTLCEYRRRILSGEIPDPRDKYNRWK